MVIDKLPDGQLKRRYLVYDLMMVNHQTISKVFLCVILKCHAFYSSKGNEVLST